MWSVERTIEKREKEGKKKRDKKEYRMKEKESGKIKNKRKKRKKSITEIFQTEGHFSEANE